MPIKKHHQVYTTCLYMTYSPRKSTTVHFVQKNSPTRQCLPSTNASTQGKNHSSAPSVQSIFLLMATGKSMKLLCIRHLTRDKENTNVPYAMKNWITDMICTTTERLMLQRLIMSVPSVWKCSKKKHPEIFTWLSTVGREYSNVDFARKNSINWITGISMKFYTPTISNFV